MKKQLIGFSLFFLLPCLAKAEGPGLSIPALTTGIPPITTAIPPIKFPITTTTSTSVKPTTVPTTSVQTTTSTTTSVKPTTVPTTSVKTTTSTTTSIKPTTVPTTSVPPTTSLTTSILPFNLQFMPCSLDVDQSGTVDATDGVLMLRRLNGASTIDTGVVLPTGQTNSSVVDRIDAMHSKQ